MGLTLLYSLLHAVKSKNYGLKTWFGILAAWNPKSLMKNGGISNLTHDFNLVSGLSRRSWSPATTGPPGPSAANYVAVDGPPGPSMAAMDGPLCRKWSPCGKQEKTVAAATNRPI